MLKLLAKLLAPEIGRLDGRLTKLEKELRDVLLDANDLHEKTYRLHQKLVKRAARAAEGSDTSEALQPVESPRDAINRRIWERRQRGRNGLHASLHGSKSGSDAREGSASG